MTTTDTARVAGSPATYTPSSDARELLARALACITSGRPLPEQLRPTVLRPPAHATVQDGIAAILAGPSGGARR